MRKWHEMAKQTICDLANGALDTEFNLTPKGCLWQDQTIFSSLPTKPSSTTSSPGKDSLSVRLYGEIEREFGSSEENLEVAVVEGGTASQRRLLQRLDVFKASGIETNLLGNQYWRLHQLQNGVWGTDEHRDTWCAPITNSGLDRQRWQRNLGSNSTQSAEDSKWNQILIKSWKQKENRNRLPILVGPHTSTHPYILNKGHAARGLNVTALDLKTRSPTRKEVNLWLPSSGSSPGGAIK